MAVYFFCNLLPLSLPSPVCDTVGDVLTKASRYALRVSRSVVVSLSLSRRNAASESKKRAVTHRSWLVKACHYPRMGCDEISQRAAQGSLYRGAGRQRRSERLKVGPYECPDWGYFCDLRPAICVPSHFSPKRLRRPGGFFPGPGPGRGRRRCSRNRAGGRGGRLRSFSSM